MTIYPCFQVVLIQINASGILALKNKGIFVCQQIMIENNNRSSGADMSQVVLQPTTDVIGSIAWSMVSSGHRRNNIVHITCIKRIIYRPINAFKKFFAILPLYQIMISDTIKDRTVHIFRIHQFDMSLQAFFIADIPGMNDKSRLFIPGIVMHIIHPVCMIFRIKYLCISNMNIPVGAVFTNPSTVRDQIEIITGLFLFYFMIMTVKCFIPRRSGNENKTFTLMTG